MSFLHYPLRWLVSRAGVTDERDTSRAPLRRALVLVAVPVAFVLRVSQGTLVGVIDCLERTDDTADAADLNHR